MAKQKDTEDRAGIGRRIREGLHISESEFARSFFEATGELSVKAIELECAGIPRAAIALALFSIAEKWSASGSHAEAMEAFVLSTARRSPLGSPKLADIRTEYQHAITQRDSARAG
jgi:hypothetical protein